MAEWWNPKDKDFLLWRGAVEGGKKVLQGGQLAAKGTFKTYQFAGYYGIFYWAGGDYLDPDTIDSEIPGNPNSNEVIFTINGILNPEDAARRILHERIDEGGFKTGIAIHNPTTKEDPLQNWLVHIPKVGEPLNGTIAALRDVIQTAGQKLYMPDRTAKLAAKTIEEYKRDNPGDVVHSVHLHSQGGAEGTSLSMYLAPEIKAKMGYFSYGSASNPVFGWDYQVHEMNLYDPVSHISGRGLLLFPVGIFDALRPDVDQNWHVKGQKGVGGWWYHSWFPSYEDKPARRP